MPRIFVGGLSEAAESSELQGKFEKYGSIGNIDIKEKKDPDGNVISRFAFINLEGEYNQIQKCVHDLDGFNFHNSKLKVEVAKESFLERLNREREEKQRRQNNPSNYESNQNQEKFSSQRTDDYGDHSENQFKKHPNKFSRNYEKQDGYEGGNNYSSNRYPDTDNRNYRNKSDNYRNNSDNYREDFRNKRNHHENYDSNTNDQGPKNRQDKHVKNAEEENMIASFKNYSNVWADSDEEESHTNNRDNQPDYSDKNSRDGDQSRISLLSKMAGYDPQKKYENDPQKYEHNNRKYENNNRKYENNNRTRPIKDNSNSRENQTPYHNEPVPKMKRYDPKNERKSKSQSNDTKDASEDTPTSVYAVVSDNLQFNKETSSGFSFMSMFDQKLNEEPTEPETSEELMEFNNESTEVKQEEVKRYPPKRHNFFKSPGDPIFDANIRWITQFKTDDMKGQFAEAQPQIQEIIRTTHSYARQRCDKTVGNDYNIGFVSSKNWKKYQG